MPGHHSYYEREELETLGFASLGKKVLVSKKASIYDPEKISIGDFSRIDDFCCLSGNISIGRNCHVTPYCLIAGGIPGIKIGDFCTLAYRVSVFSQSDDYHGYTMTNSTVPAQFKREVFRQVVIKNHVILGAGSMVLPGVILEEGTAVGAMTLVSKSTEPWGIYYGVPCKRQQERSKDLLSKTREYLDTSSDSGA